MKAVFQLLCLLFPAVCCGAYLVSAMSVGSRGTGYIALHLLLSALMLALWALSHRLAQPKLVWIVVAGVVARLVLVPVDAFTTHDVVRYLWDGRVALVGLDPYVVTPETAVYDFDPAWPVMTENLGFPTIYPPVAIALFTLCAAAGPAWAFLLWQALVGLASIGGLLLAVLWLRDLKKERHLALLALSPLVLLEGGVGAHLDVVAMSAMLLSLLLWQRRWVWWAGVALGLAVLIKFVPVLLILPLLVCDWRRGLRLLAGFTATVLSGYAVALALGFQALGSLLTFFAKWRFGSPIYSALQALTTHTEWLGYLFAPVTILSLLLLAWWVRRTGQWQTGALLALVLPFVFSPVVFPWYLTLCVPLLAVSPLAIVVLWVTVLPLTYEVLDLFDAQHIWQPATWPLWLVVGAWVLGGAIDLVRWKKSAAL